MKWNAIHHDLHLSVLAGVRGVLAVVLAPAHPTAHGVLHLRPRCVCVGGGGVEETEVRQTVFNRKAPQVDKVALTRGLR